MVANFVAAPCFFRASSMPRVALAPILLRSGSSLHEQEIAMNGRRSWYCAAFDRCFGGRNRVRAGRCRAGRRRLEPLGSTSFRATARFNRPLRVARRSVPPTQRRVPRHLGRRHRRLAEAHGASRDSAARDNTVRGIVEFQRPPVLTRATPAADDQRGSWASMPGRTACTCIWAPTARCRVYSLEPA